MAASIQFYQTNGTAPGSDTAQGTGGGSNDWDFKDIDTVGTSGSGEEIVAGDFSFHVYIKARFTGSFSSVDNVKYYASSLSLTGYGNDAYLIASGIPVANYADPTAASMSGTWDAIPVLAASGIDITTAGLIAGTAGYTDYVGLQLKTTISGAAAGTGGSTSFTMVWDES